MFLAPPGKNLNPGIKKKLSWVWCVKWLIISNIKYIGYTIPILNIYAYILYTICIYVWHTIQLLKTYKLYYTYFIV